MDRVKEYIHRKSIERDTPLVAKSAKFTAIEGKSEILGMFWGKSVKIANVLIIIIIINNAIEIKKL